MWYRIGCRKRTLIFRSFISGFAALDFTDFGRIPMFTMGRKVEIVSFFIRQGFLWDHLAAMSYSLFRGEIVLFIIPDFLTPNIHYSSSFKPRYSLFIIQLPPPKIWYMLNRIFACQEHKACFKRRATAAVLVESATVARLGFAHQTYS